MTNQCYLAFWTAYLLFNYLSSAYEQDEGVYIYGNSESYKKYFPAPLDFGEQWKLHIDSNRFGSDFIAFFATDTNRQVVMNTEV